MGGIASVDLSDNLVYFWEPRELYAAGDDAYDLMRALGRPLLPALHLFMHLPLGAGAELSPGTSPSFSTRGKTPAREGR